MAQSKESELGVILSGYALCDTSNLVRRSDLPEHKYRMDIQLEKLDEIVRRAGDDRQIELEGNRDEYG